MQDIFIINRYNNRKNIQSLIDRFPFAQVIPSEFIPIQTINKCVNKARTKFVWILSDYCDYSNFDFSFLPPPWEADQLHSWATDQRKFGDTFFICIESFKKQNNISSIEQYQHVNWHSDSVTSCLKNLDVMYISNGEPNETKNYDHTCDRVGKKIHWIRGIDNRSAAIKHAATISSTDWFFAVWAKLEIKEKFNWYWQPNYFQEPKHYIFYAENQMTGLTYGHMGLIAYNKTLAINTINPGLDFTMSQPHDVIPIISGVAHYNQSPLTTWRTAFREVIKLQHYNNVNPNAENKERLYAWTNIAKGQYSEWSLQGARDALEYYNSVEGNLTDLELTYTWQWLDKYVKIKGYNI